MWRWVHCCKQSSIAFVIGDVVMVVWVVVVVVKMVVVVVRG